MIHPIATKERDVQKAIIEYLQWRKDVYFIRNNSVSGRFLRENGSMGWIRNNKPGSPDIIVCKGGRWIGLEVKNSQGKLSEAQKEARDSIHRAGGEYHVVRSLNDLELAIG